jgi:hypothetical protein
LKIEANLTNSIDYAKLLFADFGKLLILIILDIIPIVNFIVVGYLGNVIKEPKSSKQLPPLENFVDLWIQGLKIVVASIIFMIIPLVLTAPFIALVVVSWLYIPLLPSVGWVLALLLLLVGVLLAFFLGIILSMAIVNMLKKDSFGAAFSFGDILAIIEKIGWGSYLVWLIVIFVCSIIVTALGSIPFIGWILSLAIAPIFGLFVAHSVSLIYLEGTTTEEPEAKEKS